MWHITTVFIVGPRAVGKNTILEILRLLFESKILTSDSSARLDQFKAEFPQTDEALALIAGAENQAAGGLQPGAAAVAANVVTIGNDVKNNKNGLRGVAAAGIPRGPDQVEKIHDLTKNSLLIHVDSSFEETLGGAYLREQSGVKRADCQDYDRLVKAWGVYTNFILPGVARFEELHGGHRILHLKKSEDLVDKMDKIVRFIGHVFDLEYEDAQTLIGYLTDENHPAGRYIAATKAKIAAFEAEQVKAADDSKHEEQQEFLHHVGMEAVSKT
ncbi:MAG: hypothetical protein RIT04_448 [Candidatus Parcubacteria bacterium]